MVAGEAADIVLADGKLSVSGNCVLTDIYENILLTPAKTQNGTFIGVKSDQIGCRLFFPIGKLEGLRFLCLYRFKLWWMTQWMGTCGQDIPAETQFLLLGVPKTCHFVDETEDGGNESQSVFYTVFLPVLDGDFWAVLQRNANNELEICLESGDPEVQEFEGKHLVYRAAGSNPYDVITNAVSGNT